MDDVDAAEAIQSRNMLESGDWVTQRLNGTVYLDKAPLKYWLTAGVYSVFGIHDWVARLPTATAVLLLSLLVVRMGIWAFTPSIGFYAGLVFSTSIGLFLFTRTVIPDIILTLFNTAALWCFLRTIESKAPPLYWAPGIYAFMGLAVLTKGLIGVAFPVAIALSYLMGTGQLKDRDTWRRLRPLSGLLLFAAIALPWHILAMLRNPPLLDFTIHAGPHFGNQFRGFFWFYIINEQLLRFLNERWPHDYNTVPRLWFWLYHLLWFFPWTLFLPALAKSNFRAIDRAGRMRILAFCWIGVVMLFFTFSTTQEYYSMPIYPAVALLLGSAMNTDSRWLAIGAKSGGGFFAIAGLVMIALLLRVQSLATPGDIFTALHQHPQFYTLSLGHMADLTLPALAYLKLPLLIAGVAFIAGGCCALFLSPRNAYVAFALTLVSFFQAARLALVAFDPYLSSYTVAEKLNHLPSGVIILCGKFNPLSSVFFYHPAHALQDEHDLDILEYGSLAPGAAPIEVTDEQMALLWASEHRLYVIAKLPRLDHAKNILHLSSSNLVIQSGDKYLFTNHP